jgi:hypothetical protein
MANPFQRTTTFTNSSGMPSPSQSLPETWTPSTTIAPQGYLPETSASGNISRTRTASINPGSGFNTSPPVRTRTAPINPGSGFNTSPASSQPAFFGNPGSTYGSPLPASSQPAFFGNPGSTYGSPLPARRQGGHQKSRRANRRNKRRSNRY